MDKIARNYWHCDLEWRVFTSNREYPSISARVAIDADHGAALVASPAKWFIPEAPAFRLLELVRFLFCLKHEVVAVDLTMDEQRDGSLAEFDPVAQCPTPDGKGDRAWEALLICARP